jgi:hypothetical protein
LNALLTRLKGVEVDSAVLSKLEGSLSSVSSEEAGHVHLFLGSLSKDGSKRYDHYSAAVKCFKETDNHTLTSVALTKAAFSLAENSKFAESSQGESGKLMDEAIKLCEDKIDYTDLVPAYCLSSLAELFYRFGEPILSEGVYRKAESRFRQVFAEDCNSLTALEYAKCSTGFVKLLQGLEWNNKSRKQEGDLKWDEFKTTMRRQLPRLLEVNPSLERRVEFWEFEFLST